MEVDILSEAIRDFDVDFNEVFYLTDTGKRWHGDSVSVRDKAVKTGVGGRRADDGR